MKILAIASAGGHWVQLQRMRTAWDGCDVTYVTTQKGYQQFVVEDAQKRGQPSPSYYYIIDANMQQKFKLLIQLLHITLILLLKRPDVIISTGASLGFFALKIGKLFGARTIWVDSIANSEEMSLSGTKIETAADLWLTQWENLSGPENQRINGKPGYKGSVI